MTLPASLWPEVSKGFDEALGLARDARADWLRQLRSERSEIAAHIECLLDAHERTGADDPLAAVPSQLLANAIAAQKPARTAALEAGRMVGPYRLVAPLGEGGMASVWLAEQTVNMQRRVALKIPHHGLEDAVAAASRYAKERDVLASLEHAHIARLYDAGVSAEGLPYLAMEWIDGITICRYADEHRLDVAKRVALFRQVLEAVRFAHARLVIHRDIKPSNILVTAEGQVKLLDFGIAHLLERSGDVDIGAGDARALTPECASPEQLAGGALGTTSDVYSLGVVMYELLCGQRPYHLDVLGARDARSWHDALMKAIVLPPSRLAIEKAIASARQATPRLLQRRLAGDLDAIVLKALQKEATSRYESVESLGAELDRWQRGWPVQARRATPRYLAGRFLLRHRVEVATTAAVAVALAVGLGLAAGTVIAIVLALGLGGALWLARQARQEARKAQAVQDFVIRLFTASDPEHARGREVSAKELLDRGAKRLDTELQDQPTVLARLHQEIGRIYVQLGSNVLARPHLEKALTLYRVTGLEGSENAIETLFNLTEVLEEEMQYNEGRRLIARCLTLAERHFGRRNRWTLLLLKELAWIDVQEGRPQTAADAMTETLAEADRDDSSPRIQTSKARTLLANALIDLGQFARARDELSRVLREGAGMPGYEVIDAMVGRYNLARACFGLREFEATQEELVMLLPEMDRHIGSHHDRTIKARSLWAQTLAELGRFDEAIEVQRVNLDAAQTRESIDEELLSQQKLVLAKLYKMAVRPREGLPLLREGLSFLDAKRQEPIWFGEIARRLLGELLLQDGQVEDALAALDIAAERTERLEGFATNIPYADLLQAQAMALHVRALRDDPVRAVGLLAQAQSIYDQALGSDNLASLRCTALLVWLRALAAVAPGDADAAFTVAADRYEAAVPARHVAQAELQLMRAELQRRRGAAVAQSLEEAGRSEWRKAMGREFSHPLTSLH